MKEVFIFGAGASEASAGTPLGDELVWLYHLQCSDFYALKPNEEPDLAGDRSNFVNMPRFFDLVEQIYPELKGEKKKWENRGINGYNPPYNLDKKYYIDEIARILQENKNKEGIDLIRQLSLEHIAETGSYSNNSLYKKFREGLAGISSENTSIISFNFDCLLHEDFRNGVYFDYLINFDEIDKNRKSYNKQNGISLIKLNGSLDWAMCSSCKKITLLFPHITKNRYEGLCCKIDKCQGKLQPFIFLPYEERNAKIDLLWTKTRGVLKQAEKITIIGYSFPEYDKKIRDLFNNGMDDNVKLEVIDYCDPNADKNRKLNSIKKKYACMFPKLKNEPEISLEGFQKYIEKGKIYDPIKQ